MAKKPKKKIPDNVKPFDSRGMYFIALNLDKYNDADRFLDSIRFINNKREVMNKKPLTINMAKLCLKNFFNRKPYVFKAVECNTLEEYKEALRKAEEEEELEEKENETFKAFLAEQLQISDLEDVNEVEFEKFIESIDESHEIEDGDL